MLRTALLVLLPLHGPIHLLGSGKSYDLAEPRELSIVMVPAGRIDLIRMPRNIPVPATRPVMAYPRHSFVSAILVLCPFIHALAQPGSNDPSFNPSDIGHGNGDGIIGDVRASVLQPDGRIIVGGAFYAVNGVHCGQIARLDPDGSVDPSFNTGTGFDEYITSMALQPDGKILVLGYFSTFDGQAVPDLVRLNGDGTLDPTFDAGSGPSDLAEVVLVQPDGKVLVGGQFHTFNGSASPFIVRLNADGSLDDSFDAAPGFPSFSSVHDIALQPDGRIIAVGSFETFGGLSRKDIVRLNSDGSLDASFDPGTSTDGDLGTGYSARVHACRVQPDGRVVIGGNFTSINGAARSGIARLNPDGSVDGTFAPGTGTESPVRSLALASDGSILIGGGFRTVNGGSMSGIARLSTTGTADPQFDPGTGFSGSYYDDGIHTITVQADGGVLAGGWFACYDGDGRNGLVRVHGDGSLDPSFMPAGTGFNNTNYAVALQPDGKIIVGGAFGSFNGTGRNRIVRLHPDGSVDLSFDPGTGFNGMYVESLAVLPDGDILVGGEFTEFDGVEAPHLVRLNPDGSRDADFDVGSGMDGSVLGITPQPDGRILIAGNFGTVDGVVTGNVVRLNADGGRDGSFQLFDPQAFGTAYSLALQPDGRILVGNTGPFARLNSDGSLDPTFSTNMFGPSLGPDGWVTNMALQADGKVIIAGAFGAVGETPRPHIARLNSDGTDDPSFNPGTGLNNYFDLTPLLLQPDGKVIVGGLFSSVNDVPRNGIARLNNDGSLDTAFDPGTGADSFVYAMALQTDGNAMIVGAFTSFAGAGRNRCARVLGDGTTCIPAQLTTAADPVISCGAVNLKLNGTSTIAATEVPGANKYQFRFTNIPGQPAYARDITFPTRSFTLFKWATNPLKAGRTYNVLVRGSLDDGATWCDWGPSCSVRISWTPLAPGMIREPEETTHDLPEPLVYPNPTDGENVHFILNGMDPELTTVTLDITDLFGKHVMSTMLPVNDGESRTVLSLKDDLSNGIYVVNIRAGNEVTSTRFALMR